MAGNEAMNFLEQAGTLGLAKKPSMPRKKTLRRMSQRKSTNGGFIVDHEYHEPEHKPDEYTVGNFKDLVEHMKSHWGEELAEAKGERPDGDKGEASEAKA